MCFKVIMLSVKSHAKKTYRLYDPIYMKFQK